ncbi:helix-turn-helix transcriptional regulator [Jannaschia sp. Os4]|uniref:helix-turn-helix transcriptional regulator n=1 Tax=Jannaschia sp. Os4 TaxID=2807617 RepID=UPI00193A403F|nr:helix-turn-helix transcriptional regulator [Jannaschia sp. Os4]MBM2578132.1 helix-turn-helix transcriptional regulator [Jannaschia sp. Os4]
MANGLDRAGIVHSRDVGEGLSRFDSQPDVLGTLSVGQDRVVLTRPGVDAWSGTVTLPRDVVIVNAGGYAHVTGVNTDAPRECEVPGDSWTFHPKDTEIRKLHVAHRGTSLMVEYADGVMAGLRAAAAGCLHSFQGRRSRAAVEIGARLSEAVRAPGRADPLYLEGLVVALRGLVAAEMSGVGHATVPRLSDARLGRVIDHVEANIGSALSLAALADVAALSVSQFSRAFRDALGEPAWAYVQRRRCERASELLLHGDAPIAAVAAFCGFSSQARMTRAFRRRWNVTPGNLREG